DKTPSVAHTGINQLLDFIYPASVEKQPAQWEDSQIELREVYIKASKNGKMVRKILGLKTNKESTGLFPPFLLLYTDFSCGRAEPMDQEILWCSSEQDMQKKTNEMRTEHIKSGWKKVN
ncbi:MAG: hypothetical protein EBS17_05620, partial [Flavobacteriia bacterium]|nr:hypothetical protein [Flavobacteriia bacterium]